MNQDRILQEVDKMLAAGRITEDEAARLRAAKSTTELDTAVGAIRARHAGSHLDSAIAAGDMTPEEAEHQLARLRRGEHPRGLRARLSKYRPRRDAN